MKIRVFALLLALLAAGPASALIIGDDHDLGYVEFGIPSGDADRTAYVNHLIGMDLGTSDTALGQTFTRSNADFGALPTAVCALPTANATLPISGPNGTALSWLRQSRKTRERLRPSSR